MLCVIHTNIDHPQSIIGLIFFIFFFSFSSADSTFGECVRPNISFHSCLRDQNAVFFSSFVMNPHISCAAYSVHCVRVCVYYVSSHSEKLCYRKFVHERSADQMLASVAIHFYVPRRNSLQCYICMVYLFE